MPSYDFMCPDGHTHEIFCRMSEKPSSPACPECTRATHQVILTAPATPKLIVIDYPGSKKFKAGYQHSHGDRGSDKIQVGYGGKITPSDVPKGSADGAIWQNPLG